MPTRFAFLCLLTAGAAPAADPPVPADSGIVVHVNVAALWDSPVGATLRAAKARDLEAALAELTLATGIAPDQFQTVTAYWPSVKQPPDTGVSGVRIALRKPYDRADLVAKLTAWLKREKVTPADADGAITFALGGTAVRLETPTPTSLRAYFGGAEKATGPATGPVSPALKAISDGAAVVVGVNLANLPDELRGDDLPPEARPFAPILKSNAVTLTGRLTGGDVRFDLRVHTGGSPAEAEKSLAAGAAFLRAALESLADGPGNGPGAGVVRQLAAAVGAAAIGTDGVDATARVMLGQDVAFAPLLRQVFGGETEPGSPRSAASRARATNHLKQLGLAMHNYESAFGSFPPAAVVDRRGKPLLSWRVLVLPYIEQEELYKKFKLNEPWDSPHNKKVFDEHPMPAIFTLPGVTPDGAKVTPFRVFAGGGALFDVIKPTNIQAITDGTSNTLLVAAAAESVPWTKPDELKFDPTADPRKLLAVCYGTGYLFAMADGSVRVIKTTTDPAVLKAIITRSGGEVIGDF